MDIIKVKQLEFGLKYLNKYQLDQDSKIIWSYNEHLLTFDSLKYKDDIYPFLSEHLGTMNVERDISFLDNNSEDAFSLVRLDINSKILSGFDRRIYLKKNRVILLDELINLVTDINVTDNELSRVQTDVIYNVNYLDIPNLNFEFMKVSSNSEFEPVSIISVSKN